MNTTFSKKLIEISIPLKEINDACAREKSIRHGHPSTLHLWWARRPLAAARAVLFCQLVDDPSGYVDELVKDKANCKMTERELLMEPEGDKDLSPRLRDRLVEKERERLHNLVKELVIWENTTNEKLLTRARTEIKNSWQRHLRRSKQPSDTPMPPVLDPFAGGGAIPLEAQRLGMESHASDLNPVAVLINKAMIEIPPKFAALPPANPSWHSMSKEQQAATTWSGAQGLAADVHYYGQWMCDEAKRRIGKLYPPYIFTKELLDGRPDLVKLGYKQGDELTVIAWLWARTVPSPNPALQGKHVPLVSSYWLSKRSGNIAYVEPIVENGEYRFGIRMGKPANSNSVDAGTKTGRGANFTCLLSGVPLGDKYVKEAGRNGQMRASLMAVVCEGSRGRVYVPADLTQVTAANSAIPSWRPTERQADNPRWFSPPDYGMPTYGDLFTPRQLVALTTFSDLVGEAREKLLTEGKASPDLSTDHASLEQNGLGFEAYADAVAIYLAFQVDQLANHQSSICGWNAPNAQLRNTFARQAIPMTWDFAESNVFCDSSGSFANIHERSIKGMISLPAKARGFAKQASASSRAIDQGTIISSDPPYYDNIGYADLSDFFYVWLRRSLRKTLPISMGSILVPKEEELIASPYRQGSKAKAEAFFLEGMTAVAHRWAESCSEVYPTTIYYAFKQAEIKTEGLVSTGWATFLGAILESGYSVLGTWPMRTEKPGRTTSIGTAALASSIVLVCRKRPKTAETITKREFIEVLETELPASLRELQHANLSPVDLPQSAIGPGMAIFSRYFQIIKGDGKPMSVTEALQLINHELSGILDGQVSDMDPYTRFACKWFGQYSFKVGPYGDAESIANATDVSVEGLVASGIFESAKGKARILRPAELPVNWNPEKDAVLTIWEIVHHLIRLSDSAGDTASARILAALPNHQSAEARQLCYRLFTLCDQNGWSLEAQAYNQLITNWQDYADLASTLEKQVPRPVQGDFGL
jgi:putative DNA methylase